MSDFKREDDEPGVFNGADDSVVADTIPPQPHKLSGQSLSQGSRIGCFLDFLLQIRDDGRLDRWRQFLELSVETSGCFEREPHESPVSFKSSRIGRLFLPLFV